MKVVIIGVGRRGGDCVSELAFPPSDDVSVLFGDTDLDDLGRRPPGRQVHFGSALPPERFLRNDSSFAFDAAMADRDVVASGIAGADAVFVVAGLGGGTGAGGSKAVATIAHDLGVPVAALVTLPFSFEGEERVYRGRRGYRELRGVVDLAVPFHQDQIMPYAQGRTRVREMIAVVDDVVRHAVEGLYDLLSRGLSPADRGGLGPIKGEALFGYGVSNAPSGTVESATFAYQSPFFDGVSLERTRGMAVALRSRDLIRAEEVTRATKALLQHTSESASLLVSQRTVPSLDNQVQLELFVVGDFGQPVPRIGDFFVPGPTG